MSHTTAPSRQHETVTHARGQELTVTEDGRVLNDPTHITPVGHGNSPAAWAMVLIVLAGCVAGMIGLLAENMVIIIVAAALAVVGVIVGFIMSKAGKGASADGAHH